MLYTPRSAYAAQLQLQTQASLAFKIQNQVDRFRAKAKTLCLDPDTYECIQMNIFKLTKIPRLAPTTPVSPTSTLEETTSKESSFTSIVSALDSMCAKLPVPVHVISVQEPVYRPGRVYTISPPSVCIKLPTDASSNRGEAYDEFCGGPNTVAGPSRLRGVIVPEKGHRICASFECNETTPNEVFCSPCLAHQEAQRIVRMLEMQAEGDAEMEMEMEMQTERKMEEWPPLNQAEGGSRKGKERCVD